MSQSLKILIADDNDTDRMILRTIVRKEGHEPLLAANGAEAVRMFEKERPDLILLDVLMPVMDGHQAARNIRELAQDDLVPIIFLTSLQDAQSLAECLESGGDDFLSKPYNRVILKAKIKAFGRMRAMHEKLQEHNRQMIIEQQVAKTIFDNVAHSGCLDLPNIRYSLSPLSVFNGDTVLAERKPDGGIHLFLGDFTGHGLPAAIGAMPLAEIFYRMTAKGFSMDEVLREVNGRLRSILPVGVFCCGCFIDLDPYDKTATLWLGGLPDLILMRTDGRFETVTSTNLPLGVLSPQQFKPSYAEVNMQYGDALFVWSDGIIEARNQDDEMFGESRLLSVFQTGGDVPDIFTTILSEVDDFVGEAGVDDDITLLSVSMVGIDEIGMPDYESTQGSLVGPLDWDFNYCLRGSSLKGFNPLPIVLNVLTEVEGLRSRSGQIYTMLAELYSNALEHGVLKLSSALKSSSDGFSQYYSQREERLANLVEGSVNIEIKHTPLPTGGRLWLRITDSGEGFDHKSFLANKLVKEGYSGRGIPLIREICEDFFFNDKGNQVTACLTWSHTK